MDTSIDPYLAHVKQKKTFLLYFLFVSGLHLFFAIDINWLSRKEKMLKDDNTFSFAEADKESFKARLQKLIGDRSVRAVAKDWEIPVSTLNNYLHKGTEPSFKVVCSISNKEQVSLNWLAYGVDCVEPTTQKLSMQIENADSSLVHELLRRAQSDDREKLINAICDIGIKGILARIQYPTKVPEVTQKEAIIEAIQALNIRESLKEAIYVALDGNEEIDREILQRIESLNRGRPPGDNTVITPEQENDSVGKKLA
ncbi:helix-turn-helix domain-containing protein [Yersinia enterocolitica]